MYHPFSIQFPNKRFPYEAASTTSRYCDTTRVSLLVPPTKYTLVLFLDRESRLGVNFSQLGVKALKNIHRCKPYKIEISTIQSYQTYPYVCP
jgi:hypothetical protein